MLNTMRWRQFTDAGALIPGLLMLVIALPGCGASAPEEEPPSVIPAGIVDDWPAILERGVIRFARRGFDEFETLPSQGLSKERYRFLAHQFAERYGLRAEWITEPTPPRLMLALEEGRADVAVATLTVTESRLQRVAFTVPLTVSREWVVGASEGVFGVPPGTSYEESLETHYPDAPRAPVAPEADPLTVQALIEEGVINATILDEAAARVVVRSSPEVNKLRELPEARRIAWAVRKQNPGLRSALDDFLTEHHTVADEPSEVRDWAAIRAAGQLRLLTISSPVTHYLWRGERLGFEYELVRQFAEHQGLDLAVIVARDHAELVEGLLTGRGDLVAAGWVETPARAGEGLLFTRHYLEIHETFVTGGEPVTQVADLSGRTVTVPEATSYLATLDRLQGDFEVEASGLSSHAILQGVAEGEIDVTLVDSHRAELAATFEPRLSLGLAVEPAMQLVWAVGPGRDDLKRELNVFLNAGYRGLEFNALYNKYFVNRRRQVRQREHRVTGDELSQFDALVKPAAEAEDFDWRLIVAQMYQESGFDPNTVSFAGARGLMQVMPRTAEELGVDPVRLPEPEVGIDAGVRYLAWSRERFPDLPPGEQIWFALAAYNAGYGHVRDGRRLARQLGMDGSLWFGNVEEAMLKLSDPEYASRAAHGYVRGSEVTRYVSEIRSRYRAYVDHFVQLETADR